MVDGFTINKELDIPLFLSGQTQLLKDEVTERSKHSDSKNTRIKSHITN